MSEQPSFVDLREALDPKEQRFVDEYIECLSYTLAARRVWGGAPTRAKRKGWDVAHRPDVAAAIAAGIKEQNERLNNDPDRIIRELMLLGYADPRDLVDHRGEYIPLHQLAPEIRRAISSIDVEHVKTTTVDVDEPRISSGEISPVEKSTNRRKRVMTTTRVVKYRLAAKTPNLELLGKRLKMFSERLELDATDKLAALVEKAFNRPRPRLP